ncbi:hypothetical protein [Spiribacter pallidus]|jgi:hypothetical protein|uniref:Uncharacterized protein n=1 Tax=Spiribacter pallidus TaxID=1987936 RepID=A0ABV3TDX6_9GAMM
MVTPVDERRYRAFLAAAQLRHAWQFQRRGRSETDDPVEIEIPPGWYGLMDRLFDGVAEAVPAAERGGFRWRRLRVVHGVLEIRFDGVRDRILPIVTRTRDEAAVTCQACGQPGTRRQIAGDYRVNCDRHFIELLVDAHPRGESGARRWWQTPQPALGRRSPASLLQAGPPSELLLDQALRLAMPAAPRLNGAHRQRLQGVWPVLREAFGERLRSLRLAEFEPETGPNGTLLAMLAGEPDTAARTAAANQLARAGYSDLRLRLIGQSDLDNPVRAADPWSCMLALEASVSIPRYQPSAPFDGR